MTQLTVYIGGNARESIGAARAAALQALEPFVFARHGSENHRAVVTTRDLLGYDRDTRVVLVGTFWSRADVQDVLRWCYRFPAFQPQEATRAA